MPTIRLSVALLGAVVACAGGERSESRISRVQPAPPVTREAPPAEPLLSSEPARHEVPTDTAYAELAVPGFADAVISLPRGADGPRPVLVAVHGHRHRPDWQCRIARRFVGDRAFVLCPRGVPAPALASDEQERFTWKTEPELAKEVDAGLSALKAAYPDFVDGDHPVYYGHSSGAYLGSDLVRRNPARWSRAIFAEGGFGGWTARAANAFLAAGGARVLFACGTGECAGPAGVAARTLEAAGVPSRLGYAAGAGHRSYGPIVEEVAKSFEWLTEGDLRFARVR